jgi:glycosyltransferase involved in cell wall biosynthesis
MTDTEKKFLRIMKLIKREVVPYKINFPKIRLGELGDGGYAICDGIPSSGLYSYGSDDNIKFEVAYHAKYGKECWVYDHTIPGITNKPDYIHFFKQGVSNETTDELDTIDNQVARNGHTDCRNMFAQIDIEGYEWVVLRCSEKLKEFAQVLVEFHIPRQILNCYKKVIDTLRYMNKHFVCVHVHGNNSLLHPWFDHDLPSTFECTYVRRDLVTHSEIDYQPYPIPGIDTANAWDRPDLPLTWWHHNKVGYGKVFGRFFLGQHLGITEDDTPDTCTISELIETFESWETIVKQLPFKTKQLFTMFETSDVHPDIIKAMKVFDRVIVPFDYLRTILIGHGVNAVSINFYTSDLIRAKPVVIPKKMNKDRLIFLYVGTNDVRKNLVSLTKVFARAAKGTLHTLIVKTNIKEGLTVSPNITVITDKIPLERLAGLYNICDYVISFTRGEGVGLPMVEASYFGKTIISHDQGVFVDVKDFVNVPWYVLPSKEIPIDLTHVPGFLKKVFHGKWWEVDETAAFFVIKNLM